MQANQEPLGFSRRESQVHQRLLVAALPLTAWPVEVKELARVTRPGGWIELLEGGNEISPSGPAMQRVCIRCIAGPHWYLWVLGVDPACQGQGIGGALLHAGLERADASALPCYLETMNPHNVPLYQKFGFAIASEANIPNSNVHTWAMVRPARASTE